MPVAEKSASPERTRTQRCAAVRRRRYPRRRILRSGSLTTSMPPSSPSAFGALRTGPLPARDTAAGPKCAPRTSTPRKEAYPSLWSPPAGTGRWPVLVDPGPAPVGDPQSGVDHHRPRRRHPHCRVPGKAPNSWTSARNRRVWRTTSRQWSPPAPADSRCSTRYTRSTPMHLQQGERSPSQARALWLRGHGQTAGRDASRYRTPSLSDPINRDATRRYHQDQ